MSEEIIADEVQAHGMGTELVRPDWAPIKLEEVNRLLSRYPNLAAASVLTWHSPRPFSSAAIAVTAKERLFIKRHHQSVRNVSGLTEEHRFMQHLRDQGIPVSAVIAGVNAQTAFQMDEWTYELYRLAGGTDLYRDAVSWSPFFSKAHAYAAGEALGRMHLAAESYDAPPRPIRALVSSFTIFASSDPLTAMSSYIAKREALSEYMQRRPWEQDIETVLMPFYARLVPWLDDLKPLWTHNDWHASNLLWSDPEHTKDGCSYVESILDFGLADQTNAVYDLATAIERNAIEWLAIDENGSQDIVHYEQLEALLAGYESIRPLKRSEAAALTAMLPLVHAEFALSEIDYFAGIVRSAANADLAYNHFLIGHAKWFQSREGQDLLHFLEKRYGISSTN